MGPTLRLRYAALAAAFLGLGCSVDAIAPIHTPSGPVTVTLESMGVPLAAPLAVKEVGLVDLDLGRITEVSGVARVRTRAVGEPFGPYDETPLSFQRTITGEATPVAGGPTYRTEALVDLTNAGAGVIATDLWRQDRSGLFLWQKDLSGGALRAAARKAIARAGGGARAAQMERAFAEIEQKRAAVRGSAGPTTNGRPGPLASEITFLRYPLHPNASWDGRPGFNVWYFDGWEEVETPSGVFRAARLHIDVPGQLGPDDFARTWWAAPGETRRHFHFIAEMRDENGQPTGYLEADETLLLNLYAPAGITTAQLR